VQAKSTQPDQGVNNAEEITHLFINIGCINVCWLVILNITKNDTIQGAGCLSQDDITWGQANSTCMLAEQEVNKAEELTYPYILKVSKIDCLRFVMCPLHAPAFQV
jgi:hypothetical protein